MRHTLGSRLKRLEFKGIDAHFKTLPADSVGEWQIVIVKPERPGSDLEVCQCEEQPGLAPPDSAPPGSEDPDCQVYYTEDDVNL
jgi:hypothetical protein